MTNQQPPWRSERRATRLRVFTVWCAAVVAMVLVGLLAEPARQLTWVPIAMLLLVFLTAVMQLIEGRPEGFIHRFALSLAGAVIVLALASLVFVLLGAHGTVTPA